MICNVSTQGLLVLEEISQLGFGKKIPRVKSSGGEIKQKAKSLKLVKMCNWVKQRTNKMLTRLFALFPQSQSRSLSPYSSLFILRRRVTQLWKKFIVSYFSSPNWQSLCSVWVKWIYVCVLKLYVCQEKDLSGVQELRGKTRQNIALNKVCLNTYTAVHILYSSCVWKT